MKALHDRRDDAIDLADALKRVDGDHVLLCELVRLFSKELPRTVEEMRRCEAEGDFAELERAAHTLKSALATLGANAASESARALEMTARERRTERVGATRLQLERELERVQQAMARVWTDIASCES